MDVDESEEQRVANEKAEEAHRDFLESERLAGLREELACLQADRDQAVRMMKAGADQTAAFRAALEYITKALDEAPAIFDRVTRDAVAEARFTAHAVLES